MAAVTETQKRAGSLSDSSSWSQATTSPRVAAHPAASVDLPAPAGALTSTNGTFTASASSSSAPRRERSIEPGRGLRRPQLGGSEVAVPPVSHLANIAVFTRVNRRRGDAAFTLPDVTVRHVDEAQLHEIVLRGRLACRLLGPFIDDFAVDHRDVGLTRLVGVVRDPSHLHGLVAHLASINAELISIAPLAPVTLPHPSTPVVPTTDTRSTS